MSSVRRDPCRAATKGFRDLTHTISGPTVDTSHPRKKHETEQKILKEFFYRNPTPARVEVEKEVEDDAPEIPIHFLNVDRRDSRPTFYVNRRGISPI